MIINHKKLNPTPIKIDEIVLHAMHCGGGSSQFPKLLKNNQVIFGMPKSFLGAKTCFTVVGR